MYRAFLVDAADHIFGVRVLNSTTDASALRLAAKLRTRCHLVEVWYGTRKIAEVEPRNKMELAFSGFAAASSRAASCANSAASLTIN